MRKPDFNLPGPSGVREQLLKILEKEADQASLVSALRLLAKYRSHVIQHALASSASSEIQAGPFRGMKYVDHSAEGCHIPKVIGCYEHELQPFFEAAIASGYDDVVNVGCSEGYYAVGLALRMPRATVHAYDINPGARTMCGRIAERNGVAARVRVAELFKPETFREFAGRRTLFLIDIEGNEVGLLEGAPDADIAGFDFIIECHDAAPGKISGPLLERFKRTHAARLIAHTLPGAALPPSLDKLSHLDQLLAVWEWRGHPTPWLVAASRQHPGSAFARAVEASAG
jgi:hypothetical protein